MEYITLVGDDYDALVEDARKKYGELLRIHSRRDFTVGGGLFAKKRKKTEIICYLAKAPVGLQESPSQSTSANDMDQFEKEAQTPDPDTLTESEKLDTKVHEKSVREAWEWEVEHLLDLNDIRGNYRDFLLKDFRPEGNVALSLSDRIISSAIIEHKLQAHPSKFMVLLGPTGSGKTTTMAKIGALYQSVGKRVAFITLDSYRVGAFEQVQAFGRAFNIPVVMVRDEDDMILASERFASYDLVMIDTMGISPNDKALNLKLRGLLGTLNYRQTSFVICCGANLKCEDLLKQYNELNVFPLSALIVTKLDETESIGSCLAFSYETKLPLFFCTNGQNVPSDLKKASTTVILQYLNGFGIDMRRLAAQLS